ncbi:MAG TPA: hypothetical protein VK279_13535 [Solirubrobacteraceae bacterium]|nr:hypothetical protein [Solirubrobacteraceae bacterium]
MSARCDLLAGFMHNHLGVRGDVIPDDHSGLAGWVSEPTDEDERLAEFARRYFPRP